MSDLNVLNPGQLDGSGLARIGHEGRDAVTELERIGLFTVMEYMRGKGLDPELTVERGYPVAGVGQPEPDIPTFAIQGVSSEELVAKAHENRIAQTDIELLVRTAIKVELESRGLDTDRAFERGEVVLLHRNR